MLKKPFFSVCVPAFNRAKYLKSLLDSVLSQDYKNFEIVICEDASPERSSIADVVSEYQLSYPGYIFYHENSVNLGYDGNIRNLIEKARGQYCFFLGNDDLMCEGALEEVARLLKTHKNVGLVLKSYAWFSDSDKNIKNTVRYFSKECIFKAGKQAICSCLRRSGIIAGYIIDRDAAHKFATDIFDGSLFYQMHITANLLVEMNAVFTPKVLVLCRDGERPEFGNSQSERGKYIPGSFNAYARLNMISGVLSIVKKLNETRDIDVYSEVMRNYSNYFYLCIRDQLHLPLSKYWALYRSFGRMGFDKYIMFHIYVLSAYLLGQKNFDWIVKKTQKILGRSLNFR